MWSQPFPSSGGWRQKQAGGRFFVKPCTLLLQGGAARSALGWDISCSPAKCIEHRCCFLAASMPPAPELQSSPITKKKHISFPLPQVTRSVMYLLRSAGEAVSFPEENMFPPGLGLIRAESYIVPKPSLHGTSSGLDSNEQP